MIERLQMIATRLEVRLHHWLINYLALNQVYTIDASWARFQLVLSEMTSTRPEIHVGLSSHRTRKGSARGKRVHSLISWVHAPCSPMQLTVCSIVLYPLHPWYHRALINNSYLSCSQPLHIFDAGWSINLTLFQTPTYSHSRLIRVGRKA